ncbi:glycoside hydrolase family 95 protein [Flammeovirga sp. SubArs3]|uniref:glycoside hydrolase family 95 protein n=1 Tax=Flammeovirga sp. SubArs3 TaxID=2995316 RepID=UPI00248BEC97|nr:glycoside hydrolase family 95 protein [Flammeovirga sp. SubArs3]
MVLSCQENTQIDRQQLQLWYEQPAEYWYQEALPIGNGYMGALIRGKVDIECIPINEETIWAGGPGELEEYNYGNKSGAYKHLEPVRKLLKEGKKKEAYQLTKDELFGEVQKGPKTDIPVSANRPVTRNPKHQDISFKGFGTYQTAVDLLVQVEDFGEVENYNRSLDIKNSVSRLDYSVGNTSHSRRSFASYPDHFLVFDFENNKKEGITYNVWFETFHQVKNASFKDGVYYLDCQLKNNGMEFQAVAKIVAEDSKNIRFHQKRVEITNTNKLTILVTLSSDYKNEYPTYKGTDFRKVNRERLSRIDKKSPEQIYKDHKIDYQNLFDRVSFKLGKPSSKLDQLPTDKRLERYSKGDADPGFESLYFQYGRYLLISSSRENSLPANLQGKWNVEMNPQWACDYHTDINVQMNYWPAEVANLSESHQALLNYVSSLQKPGEQSAKDFYNANGWIVNTMNNIFGYTANNWGSWGYFPAGAAWLSQHLWEHYLFTQDTSFLHEQAYPVMKGAAEFWLDYLVEDENGELVSMPSFSPEHGGISIGAMMDQEIVWDLFTNIISAQDVLHNDEEFLQKIKLSRSKLLGLKIGQYGQLQEWKEDRDDPNNKHRHVSHLFALYPGKQISLKDTPELAKATRKSLEFRGDGGTGWSIAWKVNFWARLQDANHAYLCFRNLLKECHYHNHGGMTLQGGTYPNLFCAHPPFQIDGNLGGIAGMAEMLLQSDMNTLQLLPALPKEWSTGKVKGLKARGNFEVSLRWSNNELDTVTIKANTSRKVDIIYYDQLISLDLTKGEIVQLNKDLKVLSN